MRGVTILRAKRVNAVGTTRLFITFSAKPFLHVSLVVASLLAADVKAADLLPPPTVCDVAYGSHKRQVLDFWRAESDRPTPLAVYFHGGGFRAFDKGKIVTKWSATVSELLDAGISVAAVNYLLIQHEPLPAAFRDGRLSILTSGGCLAES